MTDILNDYFAQFSLSPPTECALRPAFDVNRAAVSTDFPAADSVDSLQAE